ncbi:putative zinc-binding metallopeptidase [Caenimonas koreensis]|uniref:zinc-binding metallopeptidase family protein n=1 Tax=Caenimonas koreensis TaxID=367474 RepID=UPI003785207E
MRTFRCDHCGHALFFENVQCLHCGSDLAFLAHRLALCSIEPAPGKPAGCWQRKSSSRRSGAKRFYRLCANHTAHQACNFAVPVDDPNELCVSCRQTRLLPDLTLGDNHQRWYRIEVAKRRLFYTLAKLRLASVDIPSGLSDGPIFEFLADQPGQAVITGHVNGVITLNIAEADDAERVRRRVELREPYRTLLGHLRHESGHYYWDKLIRDGGRLESFREIFGDESVLYREALDTYYRSGAPAGWQDNYVSAYATAHPWEDWAETWAHYLHMVDLLETASSYNTKVVVPGDDNEEEVTNPFETDKAEFTQLVDQWVPLTLLVNSLNRSLGQDDAYPFALSAHALEKLKYVHDVIHAPPQPDSRA